MNDDKFFDIPVAYVEIVKATSALEFTMASDLYTGSLLKTLMASKPGGRFLELGTGSGLATSWMKDGMDAKAKLITVENNELLLSVAKQQLADERIDFTLADGYEWIDSYKGEPFDLIMTGHPKLISTTLTWYSSTRRFPTLAIVSGSLSQI